MSIRFPSSNAVAVACAMLLPASGAAAAATDDQAQAQVCRRMLDAVAGGNPDRAADIMLLEGQPPGIQVSKDGEATLQQMRALMRTTLEGALQRNGGTRPQAREPMPERRFGERIAVIERWDLGNGNKAYIGCVRFPDQVAWMTNVQVSPDESFVAAKLQEAAAGKPYPPPAK